MLLPFGIACCGIEWICFCRHNGQSGSPTIRDALEQRALLRLATLSSRCFETVDAKRFYHDLECSFQSRFSLAEWIDERGHVNSRQEFARCGCCLLTLGMKGCLQSRVRDDITSPDRFVHPSPRQPNASQGQRTSRPQAAQRKRKDARRTSGAACEQRKRKSNSSDDEWVDARRGYPAVVISWVKKICKTNL